MVYSNIGVERYLEAYPGAPFGSITGYTYAHMAYSYASHTLHAWGIPATLGATLHAEANAYAINIHTLPTSEGQWLVDANGLIGVEVGGSSDTSHFSLCPISYHRSRVSLNMMHSDSVDVLRNSRLPRMLLG